MLKSIHEVEFENQEFVLVTNSILQQEKVGSEFKIKYVQKVNKIQRHYEDVSM
jgi:hypothetical protein